MRYPPLFPFLLLVCALVFVQCAPKSVDTAQRKMQIVCTTGILKDAVQNIVGERAEVVSLMGAGVDPHLYRATQGDMKSLQKADLIVHNGLHLEGKMSEILERLGNRKSVYAMSAGLPDSILLYSDTENSRGYDPHIWFDVQLWSTGIQALALYITSIDPDGAADYEQNLIAYQKQLADLSGYIQQELSKIPAESRVLITSHDAFRYFGRAYGIEVKGLQGISTQADFGLKDVSKLTDFIIARKIKAIFVETSVPSRSLEAVRSGCIEKKHEVAIGGTLYSDALGKDGSPEGTYIGMLKANVRTIVSALR